MPNQPTPDVLAEPVLAELHARLVARRHELERVLAPGQPAADRDVGDEIDEAERQVEVNSTLSEQARARALLSEVEAALQRIAKGTYGIGEQSGQPISLARLRVVPWARDDVEESD